MCAHQQHFRVSHVVSVVYSSSAVHQQCAHSGCVHCPSTRSCPVCLSQNAVEEKVVERARMKLHLDQIVIQQGRLVDPSKGVHLSSLFVHVASLSCFFLLVFGQAFPRTIFFT